MKLYEIKQEGGASLYGTKLATNSKGQWVMEVKGTGTIVAVDATSVEEVMPHTIGVSFGKGKVYHYLAPKGVYEVGDIYVLDAAMGRDIVNVASVDTKSTNASVEFKPLLKLGESIMEVKVVEVSSSMSDEVIMLIADTDGNPQKALDLITAGFTALTILGMKKQSLDDLLEKHIPEIVKIAEEFIEGLDNEIV